MPEQEICGLDPSLCLDCMREPMWYKRELGAYVVPVCMKLVSAALEDDFAERSAEAIRKRARVLKERANLKLVPTEGTER